jgi:hypothetical protein
MKTSRSNSGSIKLDDDDDAEEHEGSNEGQLSLTVAKPDKYILYGKNPLQNNPIPNI